MGRRSLILWRRPAVRGREELAEEAFRLLTLFQETTPDFRPNCRTVRRKKDARPFSWEREEFDRLLLKNAVNKGNPRLGELGYSISFFSSLEEKNCVGYSLRTGNQSPLFVDTLVVHIPETALDAPLFSTAEMEDTFHRCIEIFRPFWGCVDDGAAPEGGYLDEAGLWPNGIQWLNWWEPAMAERIGLDRLEEACRCVPGVTWKDGMFCVGSKPSDAERKEKLEQMLSIKTK